MAILINLSLIFINEIRRQWLPLIRAVTVSVGSYCLLYYEHQAYGYSQSSVCLCSSFSAINYRQNACHWSELSYSLLTSIVSGFMNPQACGYSQTSFQIFHQKSGGALRATDQSWWSLGSYCFTTLPHPQNSLHPFSSNLLWVFWRRQRWKCVAVVHDVRWPKVERFDS